MRNISAVVLLIAVLFSSCKQFREQMAEVSGFQKAVGEKFNFPRTNINIRNGSVLQLTITNSTCNDSSDNVKQRVADSVGVLVPQYFHITKIRQGTLRFAAQTDAGIAHYSKSTSFNMNVPQQ
jgi:hypothetical protein